MLQARSLLYWRLAAYYFTFYTTVGAIVVFWGPYLQFRGFDAVSIGQLVAILSLTKIVAPYVWGWLTDRGGRRVHMIRYSAFAAALIFTGVLANSGFVWMALVTLLFSFFWNAGMPQFDATTLTLLGKDHHRYSIIRSTGSMGFIAAVLLAGLVLDRYGLQWVPCVILLLLAAVALCSLAIPDTGKVEHADEGDRSIWPVLRRPSVQTVLLAGFLMQFGFGPYNTFYSIHLQAHGYRESLVGVLWVTGTVSEVFMFYCMHRILHMYAMKSLLLFCFLLGCVRWLIIGYAADSLAVLVLAQCMHAVTFGMFHAVMIHLIHHLFTGVHQGRGQGLFNSLCYGAGAAAGAVLSGYAWQHWGSQASFSLAAAMSALGGLVVLVGPPVEVGDSAERRRPARIR
ncbi:MAG TPA: MFS transporter [Gammaproteobacteria bacterium]|nr:MFS transporter [Gammaproteobacteria bacterium]